MNEIPRQVKTRHVNQIMRYLCGVTKDEPQMSKAAYAATLQWLEEEGYVQVFWGEGHEPRSVRPTDLGRYVQEQGKFARPWFVHNWRQIVTGSLISHLVSGAVGFLLGLMTHALFGR